MKRRKVLLGGAAIVSAAPVTKFNVAHAGSAPDANRLNQDLTPFGSLRAGSASGHIPAWTGGDAVPPAGWTKGMLPPNPYGDEQPVFVVTAENMAQYKDMLSEGQQLMFKQFGSAGWKMKVYKTHRTAAYPQYLYDAMFKNVTRTKPAPGGYINGFVGAAGGKPFPILSDDPAVAGQQLMLNHNTRWIGLFFTKIVGAYVVGRNSVTTAAKFVYHQYCPYNAPGALPEKLDTGYDLLFELNYIAPPNQIGGKFQTAFSFNYQRYPNTSYEYLVGEGRIREAPQAQYDIPDAQEADAVNYDEADLFDGAIDRYDWKLVGTKEMIIGYNNNALYTATEAVFGPQFVDPELTRWEIHRCQVVEATLAPGKRMTEPFRRFYFDEDTGVVALSDAYDSQNNYWKFGVNYFASYPELPSTNPDNVLVYNFQSQQYVATWVFWKDMPGGVNYDPLPVSMFSQQALANSGGL